MSRSPLRTAPHPTQWRSKNDLLVLRTFIEAPEFVSPHAACRMTETLPVAMSELQTVDTDKAAIHKKDVERGGSGVLDDSDGSSVGKGDILSNEHTDPVLSAKMHLINNVSQGTE